MNIKKEAVGKNNNIKKHGFLFHYNIRSDTMLGIGCVAVRRISCSSFACSSKLDSPQNIRQYKFNKVQ